MEFGQTQVKLIGFTLFLLVLMLDRLLCMLLGCIISKKCGFIFLQLFHAINLGTEQDQYYHSLDQARTKLVRDLSKQYFHYQERAKRILP